MLVRVECHVPIDLRDVFHHLFHALRQFDEQALGVNFYHKLPWSFCDMEEILYRRHGYYAWHWDEWHPSGLASDSFCWQLSQMAIYFVAEKAFDEKSAKHQPSFSSVGSSQVGVDEKPRDRDNERREEERSSWRDIDAKPNTEILGYYTRVSGLFDQPAIVICMDRIGEITRNEQEMMALTVKVLIHEFSHALMDSGKEKKAYGKKDDFYHWLEESLANYLTLEVLKCYQDPQLYDYAKNFIAGQSPAYRLGGILHDQGLPIDAHRRWRYQKHLLGTRATDSVKDHKSAWLDEVRRGMVDCVWLYDNLLS